MKPKKFLEHNWCRDLTGLIWRLNQLEYVREGFVQSQFDLALAGILIERTSDPVLTLFEGIRDGDKTAKDHIENLKTRFAVTDQEIRIYIENRHHEPLARLDQEMRTLQIARDRIIEVIERRRFMVLANLRLAANMTKQIETLPVEREGD